MRKTELTPQQLCDMTMDLLLKRLYEESPHLSNPDFGNGILEIEYRFNSEPRLKDRYNLIEAGTLGVAFPKRNYDETLIKQNVRLLYKVVQHYLSGRLVPQGKLVFTFKNGGIGGCEVINEGTYRDLELRGKPRVDLDSILFEPEEDEE